jgi:hypothetical protein
VVERSWSVQSPQGDLQPYLTEAPAKPGRDLREWHQDLSRVLHRYAERRAPVTTAPTVPFGGHRPGFSPVFSRMVPLYRSLLPATLEAWWATRAKSSVVTVHNRLQLSQPQGDAFAGWRMRGRVRRLTSLHWVPVVVELWPVYDEFAMMTMTPQNHVLTSKRYFRLGHSALDRLWADLADTMTRCASSPAYSPYWVPSLGRNRRRRGVHRRPRRRG